MAPLGFVAWDQSSRPCKILASIRQHSISLLPQGIIMQHTPSPNCANYLLHLPFHTLNQSLHAIPRIIHDFVTCQFSCTIRYIFYQFLRKITGGNDRGSGWNERWKLMVDIFARRRFSDSRIRQLEELGEKRVVKFDDFESHNSASIGRTVWSNNAIRRIALLHCQ